MRKASSAGGSVAPVAAEDAEQVAEPGASGISLEEHLPPEAPATPLDLAGSQAVEPSATPAIAAGGTRVATPLRRQGREVVLRLRGRSEELRVGLAPEVEVEVVDDAIARGDAVLIEVVPGEPPAVIGALTRRRAGPTVVRGTTVTIEADDEVLLRAGRSALRLRADGDVELVGSRISATSRGLFRLVGRLLRLN